MIARTSLIILLFLCFSACSGDGSFSDPSTDSGTTTTGEDGVTEEPDSGGTDETTPDIDEPDSQPEAEIDEPPVDVPEPEVGAIEGRLVNVAGKTVGLAYLLICDAGGCTTAQADGKGEFLVKDMTVGMYKIQVLADDLGYMNMEYPQWVEADKNNSAGQDIVLVERQGDPVPWKPDDGGSVTLADGQLTLSIVAGDLKFPLGLNKEIWAAAVPHVYLPPFGDEAWTDDSEVYAFHINPLGVISTGASFGLSVSAKEGSTFSSFSVWSVQADTGLLVSAGSVSKDENGQIVSTTDLELHELTTLILVGQEASQ